ncbi:MAG TPA: FAD-dependent oxidoreductase [Burkholderiales bacterium]|nr:FAD-dependent oxidoreductase [Burkholderiales bacterium]
MGDVRFAYPMRGGFQALMDGFLPLLAGELRHHAEVCSIQPRQRRARLTDGSTYRYDALVSTLPLPQLIQAIGEQAPQEIRCAAKGLRHASMRCVHLGVARPNLSDKHWLHYPNGAVFHRVFMQGNASAACNAPGGFALTCEIDYSTSRPLPAEDDALIAHCIDDCRRVGLLDASDRVLVANQVDLPLAHVVCDCASAQHVARIRAWLAQHDIVLAGGYAEWQPYNWERALIAGKHAADTALHGASASPQAMTA